MGGLLMLQLTSRFSPLRLCMCEIARNSQQKIKVTWSIIHNVSETAVRQSWTKDVHLPHCNFCLLTHYFSSTHTFFCTELFFPHFLVSNRVRFILWTVHGRYLLRYVNSIIIILQQACICKRISKCLMLKKVLNVQPFLFLPQLIWIQSMDSLVCITHHLAL